MLSRHQRAADLVPSILQIGEGRSRDREEMTEAELLAVAKTPVLEGVFLTIVSIKEWIPGIQAISLAIREERIATDIGQCQLHLDFDTQLVQEHVCRTLDKCFPAGFPVFQFYQILHKQ